MTAYGIHYCDADLIPSPGPWKFKMAYLKDAEGRTITILGQEPTVGDLRLIEAAPELLTAITELLAAQAQAKQEAGGPWVHHAVSRETQRRVRHAHSTLNTVLDKIYSKELRP